MFSTLPCKLMSLPDSFQEKCVLVSFQKILLKKMGLLLWVHHTYYMQGKDSMVVTTPNKKEWES